MKKILCIGNASYDITFPLKNFPKENSKNRVLKKVECGGGPASNACYLLGKWGLKPYFVGVVGDDIYGRRIEAEFKSVKVNTDYLEFSKKAETTLSMIIANNDHSSRTVLTYRDKKIKLTLKDIEIEPDFILIDGQEKELSMHILNKYKNAISIIDAGRVKEDIIELCHKVNYIVASKEFVEGVTGIKIDYKDTSSLATVIEKLIDLFPNKHYVVTLEEKGSIFLDGDMVRYMPTYRMPVKDTTGAGDIFHGAFTYAICKGMNIEQAVKMGNIAGALSVRKVGGRYSVPKLKEVMDLYVK